MNDDFIKEGFGGNQEEENRRERKESGAESHLKQRGQQEAGKYARKYAGKASKKVLNKFLNQAAKQAVKQIASKVVANPWGAIAVAVVIIIVLLIYFLIPFFRSGGGSSESEQELPVEGGTPQEPIVPGLSLTKTGPSQIENGQDINYTITVNYDESVGGTTADNIIIVDKLPPNVEFVSASDPHVQSGGTIEWPLQKGIAAYTLSLIVRPTQNDILVSNTIYGRSLVSGSKTIDSSAANLEEIFNNAAGAANVPVALLKAIAKTESGVLGYSADEVTQFNTLLWWADYPDDAPALDSLHPLIRRGYAYNTCAFPKSNPICPGADVRGAMQFELGTWNSLKSQLSFSDGHDPDRRYVRDIVFGAAYFIRGKINQYDSRFNFTQNLENLNETQVRALARSYCAGNPDADGNVAACGFGRHETSVWTYYQEYN